LASLPPSNIRCLAEFGERLGVTNQTVK
jgi:hypothetical protein